jgi:hypothetical protein
MSPARAYVWGLVCHFPAYIRNRRLLLMLSTYVDDSRVGQAPLYVLAGWCAPVDAWADFSDDWDQILRMSPRIEYFKYKEARGFSGQFGGMSESSRHEKLTLLMGAIQSHKLLGVASLIPHDTFQKYFAGKLVGPWRLPYVWLAYTLMTRLLGFYASIGVTEKIQFYFDNMPGHVERVHSWWNDFLDLLPPGGREQTSSIPQFLDDKEAMPLQAADLQAGWMREVLSAHILNQPQVEPMWKPSMEEGVQRVFMLINDALAEKLIQDAGDPLDWLKQQGR